ncbi:OLC1v1008775C1 [Oldenlandia corymbosa var. corymbosa]|uniref:OLC1v1008775C1 n=1 Tax=Oldenlandia corymbosa var. corymbosa TaxID=529605 RepID=A0AAV1DQL1_OLDCO|nr:OLC1v1008775C1 [Oldenlandia corymbosa var. corymbosa]
MGKKMLTVLKGNGSSSLLLEIVESNLLEGKFSKKINLVTSSGLYPVKLQKNEYGSINFVGPCWKELCSDLELQDGGKVVMEDISLCGKTSLLFVPFDTDQCAKESTRTSLVDTYSFLVPSTKEIYAEVVIPSKLLRKACLDYVTHVCVRTGQGKWIVTLVAEYRNKSYICGNNWNKLCTYHNLEAASTLHFNYRGLRIFDLTMFSASGHEIKYDSSAMDTGECRSEGLSDNQFDVVLDRDIFRSNRIEIPASMVTKFDLMRKEFAYIIHPNGRFTANIMARQLYVSSTSTKPWVVMDANWSMLTVRNNDPGRGTIMRFELVRHRDTDAANGVAFSVTFHSV